MTALGRIPCPDPAVELEEAGQYWSAYLDEPDDAGLFTGTAPAHRLEAHQRTHHRRGHRAWSDWSRTTPRRRLDRPSILGRLARLRRSHPHEAEQWAAKAPAWPLAPAGVTGRTELVIMLDILALHDVDPTDATMRHLSAAIVQAHDDARMELATTGRVLPGVKETPAVLTATTTPNVWSWSPSRSAWRFASPSNTPY